MPPKPKKGATPPRSSYIFEFIVNTLLIDAEAADYNKILITIKIGELVKFDLPVERIDSLYKKTKISHEIILTQEQLENIAKLAVNVHFNELTPEMEKNLLQSKNEPPPPPPPPPTTKKKTKIELPTQDVQKVEEKVVDNHFGEFKIIWHPIVVKRVTDKKFSIQTQFEESDIYKPIIKEEPTEEEIAAAAAEAAKKLILAQAAAVAQKLKVGTAKPSSPPPEPEKKDDDDEDIPREIIGFISCVMRFQVKPITERGTLTDTDGILNVADEIENVIDTNDTIFVIGQDDAAKYEKFLTNCNDMHCPIRIDISKFRSLHGRLVNSPLIISPCGNLECCNECSDEEDCFCNKVVSELEETRRKNFCCRKKKPGK